MGSPAQPSPEQYAQLEGAGRLSQLSAAETVTLKEGQLILSLQLARQAVVLLVLNAD